MYSFFKVVPCMVETSISGCDAWLEGAVGSGRGLAALADMGLLVTSDSNENTLSVWDMNTWSVDNKNLRLLYTLGDVLLSSSSTQFHFRFGKGYGGFRDTWPLFVRLFEPWVLAHTFCWSRTMVVVRYMSWTSSNEPTVVTWLHLDPLRDRGASLCATPTVW